MKKFIPFVFLSFFLGMYIFAGDAAVFVDEGFSKDGSIYVFGQYGKKDRSFEPYAEIFVVDVAKNDFVTGGIFKSEVGQSSVSESALSVFEKLEAKNFLKLKKYDLKKINADNLLYVSSDENKKGFEKIIFSDFEASTLAEPVKWSVELIPSVSGNADNASSSFYISVKKQDASGRVIKEYKAGSPDIRRKGVSGYNIEKILRDDYQKSLVFVIEKTVEDKNGISIRYMVETLKL